VHPERFASRFVASDRLDLSLANRFETSGGYSQNQETALKYEPITSAPLAARDFTERAGVALICEVRQGMTPWKMARLDDISQAGFRIALLPNVKPDVPLRIRIPGLQMLTANIRWHRGKAVGCEFAEPLHVAVFEHIVRQCRSDQRG
jgi:hypothetical protein